MTPKQIEQLKKEIGSIKGDIAFLEEIVLNTNYKSEKGHTHIMLARKSIAKIKGMLTIH